MPDAGIVIDVVHEGPLRVRDTQPIVVAVDVLGAWRMLEPAESQPGAQRGFAEPALAALAREAEQLGVHLLLAGLVNARPAAARVAALVRAQPRDVLLACAGSWRDGARELAVQDSYCAGVLTRLLLEELDATMTLSDGAGVAVSLTSSYVDDAAALSGSTAGRELSAQDRNAAAQRDLVGSVPMVSRGTAPDTVSLHASP